MKYVEPQPHIEGWMGPDELQWLYEHAGQMQQIVEIGSWMGKSTHALLSGCPGIVYVIDHFKGSPSELNGSQAKAKTENIRARFDGNVGHFPNLCVLQTDSLAAAATFPDGSVDMIFIDGEHTYDAVKADLLAWLPKCKRLLCGHDIGQDGVPRAVKEILGKIKNETGSLWSFEICGQ